MSIYKMYNNEKARQTFEITARLHLEFTDKNNKSKYCLYSLKKKKILSSANSHFQKKFGDSGVLGNNILFLYVTTPYNISVQHC